MERASVSKIVSTGSEIGLSAENYLTWLAQDPDTKAVGLVLESIKDVPAFVAAVTALREAGKPLVVLRGVDRSDLLASHGSSTARERRVALRQRLWFHLGRRQTVFLRECTQRAGQRVAARRSDV